MRLLQANRAHTPLFICRQVQVVALYTYLYPLFHTPSCHCHTEILRHTTYHLDTWQEPPLSFCMHAQERWRKTLFISPSSVVLFAAEDASLSAISSLHLPLSSATVCKGRKGGDVGFRRKFRRPPSSPLTSSILAGEDGRGIIARMYIA
jgi:hypothetical protein